VLEAMAAGCPVICSRVPALLEIAGAARGSGGVVDYFDPRSPDDMAAAILRRIALPAAERARLANNGRKWAGAYTWERAASATWALLLERSLP